MLTIKKEAVNSFRRAFVADHIGRDVEVIGEHGATADILVTYGSSDYDTRQMSQLIDSITQDCRTLGISTLEDFRVNEIIKEWERSHEK